MRRLSVIDGIFLRTHQGMGTPIALQGLWRTADVVDPAQLRRLHEALCAGPLGRRVVRPRVPGARARWQSNIRAHPLGLGAVVLHPGEILSWADALGTDLDPRRGPGWRLSAAPLTDGGTIIALTCSHVLADARGLIIAVEQALWVSTRGDSHPAPGTTPSPADDPSTPADPHGDPESDWADAGETWATVLSGTTRAFRNWVRWPDLPAGADNSRPAEADRTRSADGRIAGPAGLAETGTPDSGDVEPAGMREAGSAGRGPVSRDPADPSGSSVELPVSGVVLRCPTVDWERIAASRGGTANSLFIWLVANILWAAGFPERRIVASLPVDTRDEPRIDNDLAMTEIVVDPTDGPADIRGKSRAAYERRMSSPGGLPEEFLYLVPDRVAYLLSRGAGERDILCSNIGVIPPALHALGPHDCTGVATRAIHPGLTYAGRPRTRISGYLCRFRDDYLLTLMSLDPARVSDSTGLHRLAERTAGRVGLPIGPW
ncbi:hypothetical protein [Nocardia sp. NPDC051750]|uniref:hypothetical protein n=1 Tax=Nocardia sp. NPDC051750 TaxID=3364325 RepID=UPI00379E3594